MLYRIDFEKFMVHMIDHFPGEELLSFHYVIVSAGILNQGRLNNVVKVHHRFYPSAHVQEIYLEHQNQNIFQKMYFDELEDCTDIIYETFLSNLLKHSSVLIICKKEENHVVDALIEFLKKYAVECVDLNKLFTDGSVDKVYVDIDEIEKKTIELRKRMKKVVIKEEEATSHGRARLLSVMNDEQKLKKLSKLGIDMNGIDVDDYDKLLIEYWVEDE